ncbi:MAG: hypothetical protein M1825_002131 [Sarcosagium campestre]|nr:MAG: hypothetical protein M1825_002131 [Sarcosagium campestre]
MSPNAPTDVDAIQNKVNVLFAEQQRLLSTWLPPQSPSDASTEISQEARDREEEAMFAPVPSTLGVGASVPKNGAESSTAAKGLSASDLLRRKLMGRRGNRLDSLSRQSERLPTRNSNNPAANKTEDDDDDDDESSRSNLGGQRRNRQLPLEDMAVSQPTDGSLTGRRQAADTRTPVKRSSNYLDEILAEKALRLNKKKRKRQKNLD